MPSRSLTFPLLLSFAELGMLSAFVVLYFDASYRQKTKTRDEEQQSTIGRLTVEANSLRLELTDSNHRADALQQLTNELTGALASTEGLLDDARAERDKLNILLKSSQANLEMAQARLSHVQRSLDESKSRTAALENEVTSVTSQLATANERLRTCESRLAALEESLRRQPHVAKVVAGIKGDLSRVVILFDCSGSMRESGRWEHARNVVKTWVKYLDIGECALITFSTEPHLFTVDGEPFLHVGGPAGEANRELLLQELERVEPNGVTDTLSAFRQAYEQLNVKTIILFSDGAPNKGNAYFDSGIAASIYDLCREHKNITVNTVGLGDYFEEDFSTFLMHIARETDGAFLGR